MTYPEFLHIVIETGIAGARADYSDPKDAAKLRGSLEGFELCRKQPPDLLILLLDAATQDTERADPKDDYWFWRCRAVEIEWVCNVVSAALRVSLKPHLPTVRAVLHASRILGTSDEAVPGSLTSDNG